MKKLLFLWGLCFLVVWKGIAQNNEDKYLAGFKITDYIVKEEGAYIVQVYSPQVKIPEKAIAILYDGSLEQERGYYKCLLIKGDYYYFACNTGDEKVYKSPPQAKDIILVVMPKPKNMYFEQIGTLAAYGVEIIDTEKEEPIFQVNEVLSTWTKEKEEQALQKMVEDIRLVGKYMKENNPEIDRTIEKGHYKGKKMLDVMMKAEKDDVKRFFSYIKARPAKYIGQKWKISEIFATWIVEGAPEPIGKK
ncbi:hypothetical protein [Raineya orbicola]|uniref:Uncharacterized protein n=1 Tax=Raineya orbicola TaxID=2016530 RepID=A0A2N3IF58_9BACT|nr:hypothetical protein [Raineya orbicola]PKQ68949.1 hypothetical protein Rain11_1482 [Raineya orbicola]